MDATRYVSFHGTKMSQVSASGSVYLSFLPDHNSYRLSDGLQYRFYELEDLVAFEVWGDLSEVGARLDLLPKEIGFWQLYQFVGTTCLFIPHNLEVSENRCLPLASRRDKVVTQLRSGKVRMLIVGYKRKRLPLLLEEYPSLGRLGAFENDPALLDILLPDMSVNHRFRKVLRQISELIYRPFHTRYELGLQLGLLFTEMDGTLQKTDGAGAYSQLSLYYEALDYIRHHAVENLTKEIVAQALRVSSRTLNRAFEGRPIKINDFIQRLRLNKARDLLDEGNMTVEEVAHELHYPNRRYFSQEFKKYFFDSPSSIKKSTDDR